MVETDMNLGKDEKFLHHQCQMKESSASSPRTARRLRFSNIE